MSETIVRAFSVFPDLGNDGDGTCDVMTNSGNGGMTIRNIMADVGDDGFGI